ncbi:probable RNA polymerase II nuclear localization protein SLC7A6OS [Leptopilina boulardi]|uniref:probable RNA polymerase II nuclear localization protein SLC7A6OS n=1 Tax=Leptopilina boulardi TaxID=63433 RepID=UPI0021F60F58|nr:probable RNA polymerase II nuclear localization protein SLC7A6OS [Leptopilina boulardi]
MAAVFRVKRRNEDEPIDALLVACKKRKISSDATNEETASISTVVKFVGTVKDPDQNVLDHITKKLTKEELKTNYKQHVVNVADKIRKETRESSAENRFKVINRFRSLNNSKTEDSDVEEITVIDVEDTNSCKEKVENPDNKDNYVYDLYYTVDEVDENSIDYIEKFNDQLVFDAYRENGVYESDNDSEDSNDEGHWRNDYPDSDHSENSIAEDDMKCAVDRLKIEDEESDLSSDDEDFAYGLDKHDEDYFGTKYARFKARVKYALDDEDDDDDDDDDDDGDYVLDSSKSDSD